MLLFTIICSILMYLFIDFMPFVELVGFFAVFTEALLGVPQVLRNYHNKSTDGMRWDSCVYSVQWHECVVSIRHQLWAALQMMYAVMRYTDYIKAFCLKNVIAIACILNVISFTPVRKVHPSLPHLSWNKSIRQYYVQISCTKFHPDQTVTWKIHTENHSLFSKLWLSLCWFLWNSQLRNYLQHWVEIFCTKFFQEVWKVQAKICLHP
jgi:hypothetical protein